jgi:flavocytochrome c
MNQWDETNEVVIIGSGLAGLAAAIEARLAGTQVLVLEKMPITGGNTRISDGGLAAPNNFLQIHQNIQDSPQLFFEDMMKAGLGLNHPELVRTVANNAAQALDWTRNELGVKYLNRLDRFGGHSVARCVTTRRHSGVDIIKAQMEKLRELNVEVRTRCRFHEFILSSEEKIIGVSIEEGYRFANGSSPANKKIGIEKAVVIATGGFSNDIKFRSYFYPSIDASIPSTNHRGATAEAMIAALKIKALAVHLSRIQLGPWGCPDEIGYGHGARFSSYSLFPHGILIDPTTGRRIVNEWADRRIRSDAIMAMGHPGLGIVDANGAKVDAESLTRGLDTGKIKAFDTMDSLAKAHYVPHNALITTVEIYNEDIQNGVIDSHGKALSPSTLKIETPPFYTIRIWPKVHYTPGGIAITPDGQVMNLDGNPMPRLFAAGEVCGGVHGASRLGSCALTECIVFGRIAGKKAAESERF